MGLIASICRLYVGQSFPLRLGAVVRTFSLDSSQVLQSSSIRSLSLFLSPFQPLSTATQAEIVKMGEHLMIVYQSAMQLPLELPSSPSVFPLPIALREQIQSRFIDNNEALNRYEERFGQLLGARQNSELLRTLNMHGGAASFLFSTTPEGWRADWTSRERRVLWWRCERLLHGDDSPCVELEIGKELMACGRVSEQF